MRKRQIKVYLWRKIIILFMIMHILILMNLVHLNMNFLNYLLLPRYLNILLNCHRTFLNFLFIEVNYFRKLVRFRNIVMYNDH